MNTEVSNPDNSAKMRVSRHLLAAMGVAAIIVGWGVYRDGQALNQAAIAGQALGSSIVIWLIFWFVFAKRTGSESAVLSWLLIVVAGWLSGAAINIYHESQQAMATAGMESAFKGYVEGKNGFETQPAANGQAGALQVLVVSFMKKLADDSKNYQTEITKSGFPDVLSPNHLNYDPDLVKSKQSVRAARAIVEKYRNLYFSRVEQFPKSLDSSGLPDTAKAEVLAGFARSSEKNREANARMWDLQEASVAETSSIIDLLARSRGSWEAVGDQVVFTREPDLESYQTHLGILQSIERESEAIRAQQVASTQAKFEQLKVQ